MIVILQYYDMGATKTDHFNARQNSIASLAKALAHPARVAIVEYLMSVETCICSDIVDELPLAQPTVSQHLKELKSAGWIKGSVEGTAICYCIDERAVEILQKYFTHILAEVSRKNDCC